MLTREERLNNAIASARVNGTTINDASLSGLGSKCVPCPECDGTGLPRDTDFRHIELCPNCNGRGFVSLAQPKKVKGDFDVCGTKDRNGTR